MAEGFNRTVHIGNLGADPELHVGASGNAVLKLRLACSESYLDRNRVRQERTEWVSVVVFGRRAEALAKILKKGAKILVEGSLQTNSWTDDSGTKRYRTQVVARTINFASSSRARSAPDDPERRRSRRDHYEGPEEGSSYDNPDYGDDDDIPF